MAGFITIHCSARKTEFQKQHASSSGENPLSPPALAEAKAHASPTGTLHSRAVKGKDANRHSNGWESRPKRLHLISEAKSNVGHQASRFAQSLSRARNRNYILLALWRTVQSSAWDVSVEVSISTSRGDFDDR